MSTGNHRRLSRVVAAEEGRAHHEVVKCFEYNYHHVYHSFPLHHSACVISAQKHRSQDSCCQQTQRMYRLRGYGAEGSGEEVQGQ